MSQGAPNAGANILLSQVKPDAGSTLRQFDERRPVTAPPDKGPVIRDDRLNPERALPGDSKIRVNVRGFRFIGNTVLGEPELAALLAGAVGKEAGIEELNDAARAVRRAYLDRGYFLAQTYLPEQEVRDGVVTIAVLEGRLSAIKVEVSPGAGVSEKLIRGMINQHLGRGSYITERTLERPLLLIRDLPGLTAESVIQAGAEIGYADLIVRVKKDEGAKRIDGTVDFDNHGNRFSGEYRLGLTANLNNPLGLGDLVTARVYGTSESDTTFGRLGYVIPVWVDGTRAGLSVARLEYGLGQSFAPLNAGGEATVQTAFLIHPLIRTRSGNLFFYTSFDDKRTVDRQANNPEDRRKLRMATLQLSGDLRDRYMGLSQGSIGFTQGKLMIENSTIAGQDRGPNGQQTQGPFKKWNYEFKRLQQLRPGMSVLFSVAGQWASKNLASSEKLGLGGAERVRAYPDSEATGDTAYYGTLEFRYLVPGVKLGPAETIVSAFYDFGWSRALARPDLGGQGAVGPNERRISGAGLGLNVGQSNNFLVRASMAWRLDEAPVSDTRSAEPRFWLQAIKWF